MAATRTQRNGDGRAGRSGDRDRSLGARGGEQAAMSLAALLRRWLRRSAASESAAAEPSDAQTGESSRAAEDIQRRQDAVRLRLLEMEVEAEQAHGKHYERR